MSGRLKVKFEPDSRIWPWWRQLPNNKIDEQIEIITDDSADTYDYLVIYGACGETINLRKKSIRTVFVSPEPRIVYRYNEDYLAQFDWLITTDKLCKHKRPIFTQVGLPWHIGAYDESGSLSDSPLTFSDLQKLFPEKTKLCSVICSNKTMTQEHKDRLDFVMKLKERFKNEIDVFGRGFNEIPDKSTALLNYRYHIALENCSVDNYWTEKLADPYLALTYPIYYGCPNLAEYFDVQSFTHIDIKKPELAFEKIEALLHSDHSEQTAKPLISARNFVLEKYNFFYYIAELIKKLDASNPKIDYPRPSIIRSEGYFLKPALNTRMRNKLAEILSSNTTTRFPTKVAYRFFQKSKTQYQKILKKINSTRNTD